MKFGLFGGASAATSSAVGDSMQGLSRYVDYICDADRLGYHGVFLVEHHFTGTGQISSALSLLSFLAAKTERIRLGTGVVVLPWHNPVLLAEQVATIDQLSGGRFDFGVGRGYRPNEFAGFRMTPEEATARYAETLSFLKRCWNEPGRWDHRGAFYNFDNVVIDPPTVQRPHPPMWVGAASDESIRKAGAEGFNLLLDQIGTPDVVSRRIELYREAVEGAGRSFHPEMVGVTRALHLVHNDQEWRAAHELRAKLLDQLRRQAGAGASSFAHEKLQTFSDSSLTVDQAALIGYPDEIAEKIELLRASGVDYILLADVTGSSKALHDFAKHIMPRFTDEPARADTGAAPARSAAV